MKTLSLIAFLIVLSPGLALAQCNQDGDPVLRYGFGWGNHIPYNQPGPDYASIYPGQTIAYNDLGPANAPINYLPTGRICLYPDTLCFHAWSLGGWTVAGNPPFDQAWVLQPGYMWYSDVFITAPCDVSVGQKDTIIARAAYVSFAGVCDLACPDCADPNISSSTGMPYYNADTLIVTVVAPPSAIGVLQDTLSIVGSGQTQAYVPFTICNLNECATTVEAQYSIFSTGHIPMTVPGSSIEIEGGECSDVYAILDAGYTGSVRSCTYDTLTIIAWSEASYDTCVQIVHVVEDCCVPALSAPMIGLLLAALAAAAAIFIKRRVIATS